MNPNESKSGVLQRAGHTEAAVDLRKLAGLLPAGVLAELVNEDGTMSRMPDLVRFARKHDMVLLSVADVVRYRMGRDSLVTCTAGARVPTAYGDFAACTYISHVDGAEHVAFVCGVSTPSTRTWRSASPSTAASTAWAPRSSATSVSRQCG